ncbi:hypothetical protein J2857_003120 [Neorhizobium galegae]|uniref:hypothetical protein n=1 Tax=Neorhizobium galegae TaxID=399 RepID=UPI001AE1393D|nr:hypothetical protein [Neorhizobium galegae]MBP2560351.1 hypothetical protein [Neorhizobium galegae]
MTGIQIQSRGRRIAWSRLNLLRAEYYEERPELLPADPNWRDLRPIEPQEDRPADILSRSQKSSWFDTPPGPSVTVRRENDGPTAEWLAERDAAGIATNHGREGNRIERALVEDKSPLAATLRQVAELLRPPVVAANDNTPPAADANPGKEGERVHNQGSILPSVPMLLRAYAPLIETSQRRQDGGWYIIGTTDGRRKLTGLIFRDGELIAFGDDRGRKCRPDYVADPLGLVFDKGSETAKHIERRQEENRAYTRLSGAGLYLSDQRTDAPRSLAPPPRTARAVANDNILSKAKANTTVMPPVTKLPDGVAREYGRLAGIAEANGTNEGATSAPLHEALAEMERAEKFEAAGFDRGDMEVVEDILSDASFRTIGLARGYAESSAHRMGRKVVEDVLKRVSTKIAA